MKQGGVCHNYGLAIYIKEYLKVKEEFYGNSNISQCKNITNLQKNPLKKKPKSFKILELYKN